MAVFTGHPFGILSFHFTERWCGVGVFWRSGINLKYSEKIKCSEYLKMVRIVSIF
jgi:hypothetical protein